MVKLKFIIMFIYLTIFTWILVLFLFFDFRKFRTRIRISKLVHQLPGPKRFPILGDLFILFWDEGHLFKKLRQWGRKHAPLYVLSATTLFVSANVTGAEEFEKIASTTKNIKKSPEYFFLNGWLGEGLLTSTGKKWHVRRKILTPAFHFTILQQFISIFNNETRRLVNVLKKETNQPYTNIVPLISQFTLYSITETSMGTALNMENKEDKNYVSAIYQIGNIMLHRIMRPWLYLDVIFYNFFPSGRKQLKILKTLQNFTDNIVSKRAENFQKFDIEQENNYNYSNRKKLAFLDLLLNAKITSGIIDDQGIKDEVNTFLFEGHDTTAMSICFTIMLLANHPNFQEMIFQEIVSILGATNESPDLKNLNELKIMDRFIKESLRLYPSVAFIARTLDEDTLVGGYLLPRKTIVHIHVFDIHRNPKYWPNPEKFDPDRFLPENCVNRHPFSYVPFSAGPRNCIGQRFAILEIKSVLSGILRNFILEPIDTPNSIVLIPDLVLRTKNAMLKVKFIERENKCI